MQTHATPHNVHIFVCQVQRGNGKPSCGENWDSEAMIEDLKKLVLEKGLEGVRVTRSGCLGPCAKGPNVMIYPQKLWLQGEPAKNASVIIAQLEALLGASSGENSVQELDSQL